MPFAVFIHLNLPFPVCSVFSTRSCLSASKHQPSFAKFILTATLRTGASHPDQRYICRRPSPFLPTIVPNSEMQACCGDLDTEGMSRVDPSLDDSTAVSQNLQRMENSRLQKGNPTAVTQRKLPLFLVMRRMIA